MRVSYVCRHGLYVVYIVTQTSSFRRSHDLDKSNKFRQMQELTNDYYSESKLHNILHIAYKAIEFSTNKKNQQLHSRSQYWNDNGFVHKANSQREFVNSDWLITFAKENQIYRNYFYSSSLQYLVIRACSPPITAWEIL